MLESVKLYLKIIHHYRDEYLRDPKAPYDHVAIFDEAQRAWTERANTNSCINRKSAGLIFNILSQEFFNFLFR